MDFRRAVILILGFEFIIAAFAYFNYGFTLEGLQAVTRYSGRLSLALFSVLFIFLPDNEKRVHSFLSPKPFHVFALAHGIHLIELLAFVYLSGNELIPIRLAGGFLAYLMIFAMPLVHTGLLNQKIPIHKFLLFQTIYIYYVWFIFFMSYLPRVQGKLPNVGGSYWEFALLLSWVCMLLGMKLSALLLRSKVHKNH